MERTPWVFTRQNGEKSAFWIVLHCIAPPKGLPYPFVTPLSQTYSTSFHHLFLSVYKERKHFPCSRLFSSFSPLACLLRNRVLMAVWQLAAFGDFRDEMCSPRERAKRKRKGIGKWGPSLIFSNVSNRPRHLLRRRPPSSICRSFSPFCRRVFSTTRGIGHLGKFQNAIIFV